MTDLQQQIEEKLSRQVSNSVDFEIMANILCNTGWTPVSISRLQDNRHAIDITLWLEENVKENYLRDGRHFIFENPKEAMWFMLKWSS